MTYNIDLAFEKGYLSRKVCFNSVLNAFDDPRMTLALMRCIEITSLPVRFLERSFAIDSNRCLNEVLCRIVCHNICCLIGAMYKFEHVQLEGLVLSKNVIPGIEAVRHELAQISERGTIM